MADRKTYSAKLFKVSCGAETFKLAGTLDGLIDFATPRRTYQLSLEEAQELVTALKRVIADVKKGLRMGGRQ